MFCSYAIAEQVPIVKIGRLPRRLIRGLPKQGQGLKEPEKHGKGDQDQDQDQHGNVYIV
uniref:Uncharacterized protein n=1 Tax=Oryza barthii TaxID=65489 RepID=A0A679B9Y6_9ORYZ|nr:hypothetical protein [Oryza barthii]BBF89397.1 hypothetical protein [Oryza barthii]